MRKYFVSYFRLCKAVPSGIPGDCYVEINVLHKSPEEVTEAIRNKIAEKEYPEAIEKIVIIRHEPV